MRLTPRVVLMDDETQIRRPFKRLLAKEGLDARIARSPAELIRIVSEDHFDAAIVDIRMSKTGTEGLSVISTLREMSPDMYVEALTAFGEFREEAFCPCYTMKIIRLKSSPARTRNRGSEDCIIRNKRL